MGAMPPQVLAVDLGTSGLKAALIGHDGVLTGWAARPVGLRLLPGGGAEQDPDDWWQALVEAASDLGRDFPEAMRAVEAVCCSTQGEGTIAVGRDDEALTPCISWMDMRGAPHLARQFGGRPTVRGLSARRVERWLRITGGMPSPTGKDPAAHMLWIRDELPEVYERTEVFLNVLDYLNLRLTGQRVATVDSILTSWVTDNRSPGSVRYHDGLVADCGIEASKLPRIVACTEVLGELRTEASEALGLSAAVVVVAGAIDTTAAAVGAGTTQVGAPHLYIGTSSWLAAHVPRKKTDVVSGLASVPCALPDRYLMIALQATAGGNLEWLRGVTGGGFEDLEVSLEASEPGAGGALWTPWLYGERAPVDDLALRGGLLNVSLASTRHDLVRAVYEGVALNTRWLLNPVGRFLGGAVHQVVIAGGGARSDRWCQIFADVCGVRVVRQPDPIATNARGAAWIASVALGRMSFDQLPGLLTPERVFEPALGNISTYDDAFDAFKQAHRRLAPLYRRLAR